MNLPNALTLVRMFLVPLLVVVLLTEFEGRRVLGFSPSRRSPTGSTATLRGAAGR
jgi:phosphatidylglycerophosphate synthase